MSTATPTRSAATTLRAQHHLTGAPTRPIEEAKIQAPQADLSPDVYLEAWAAEAQPTVGEAVALAMGAVHAD